MKIQCDVCSKKEASVFCTADEAALCDRCDQRVHHANKLASKHHRFSLLSQNSSPHFPLCDICQDKRALIFCQQDRAILCRDCEIPLHTANELTKKHNRFLLTGIKLSEISDSKIIDANNYGCDPVPDFNSSKNSISSVSSEIPSSDANITAVNSVNNQLISDGSTNNISEYLLEMQPGWHFEDFLLDSSLAPPFGLCKSANNKEFGAYIDDINSFLDMDFDMMISSSTQSENLGNWVPQAAIPRTTSVINQPSTFNNQTGFVEGTKQGNTSITAINDSRKWKNDDGFTVPQITQSVGFKRMRPF